LPFRGLHRQIVLVSLVFVASRKFIPLSGMGANSKKPEANERGR
jgi:hypothetical protein